MKLSQIAALAGLRDDRRHLLQMIHDITEQDENGEFPSIGITVDGIDYELPDDQTDELRDFAIEAAKRRMKKINDEITAMGIEIDEVD